VTVDCSVRNAIIEASAKGLGMTTIVDKDGVLQGIFTDGDLRRTLDSQIDFQQTAISEIMTRGAKTIEADALAAGALAKMEEHQISVLVVVDAANRPVGAVQMYDLLKAGLA
jgi:arabinose-5-phosphate isomerase